jgi:hypothetical protein
MASNGALIKVEGGLFDHAGPSFALGLSTMKPSRAVHHKPDSLDVDWIWMMAICVPGLIGMLWFSWRLHQSINKCKVPEDSLIPKGSSRTSSMAEKWD